MNRQAIERIIRESEYHASLNRVRFRGRVIPLRASDSLTYERLNRLRRRDLSLLKVAVFCLAISAAAAWYLWVTI